MLWVCKDGPRKKNKDMTSGYMQDIVLGCPWFYFFLLRIYMHVHCMDACETRPRMHLWLKCKRRL